MSTIENQYQIDGRLSYEQIENELRERDKAYAGRIVVLVKNGEAYRIERWSILNHNGIAEYAVHYHPVDLITNRDFTNVKHTRPARELFDGRFLLNPLSSPTT